MIQSLIALQASLCGINNYGSPICNTASIRCCFNSFLVPKGLRLRTTTSYDSSPPIHEQISWYSFPFLRILWIFLPPFFVDLNLLEIPWVDDVMAFNLLVCQSKWRRVASASGNYPDPHYSHPCLFLHQVFSSFSYGYLHLILCFQLTYEKLNNVPSQLMWLLFLLFNPSASGIERNDGWLIHQSELRKKKVFLPSNTKYSVR